MRKLFVAVGVIALMGITAAVAFGRHERPIRDSHVFCNAELQRLGGDEFAEKYDDYSGCVHSYLRRDARLDARAHRFCDNQLELTGRGNFNRRYGPMNWWGRGSRFAFRNCEESFEQRHPIAVFTDGSRLPSPPVAGEAEDEGDR